jgi:DNA repair photolyase
VPLGPEPFEQRIFVKRRSSVLRALDTDLRKLRRRTVRDGTQTLLIGSSTDPYQPAERLYQITRTILDRLRTERGIRIGIITKSPLICRDIDLLKALARRNLVSVYISLISADINIIKQFEARSPIPHVRLRALDKLTRNGIRAGLLVAPILPGITDTVQQIELLMSEARDAGAHFVHPVPLRMYSDTRKRVLPILASAYPGLVTRYHANYDKGQNVPDTYLGALRTRFRDIGRRFGIEDTGTERDYTKAPKPPSTQLTFWES